ncbi:Prephenate dehydratase [Eubacterium ruminantium]|nr:Prephenate dehydratase [Eubacterium ruminantium]
MNDISVYRDSVNEIDKKMAALFEERLTICRNIAAYKQANGLPVHNEKVEALKLENLEELIQDEEIRPYYVSFLKSTMDISSSFQEMLLQGMKIIYVTDESGESLRAATEMFPGAELIEETDYATAYKKVESGDYDIAVLPLENSLNGEYGAVLDLMYQGSLHINRIHTLQINTSTDVNGQINSTRYAAFSRTLNESGGKKDDEKFIITFTVKNEAGALASTLNIIGAHGYNMRSLRSRPLKSLSWSYYFYIEAEGKITTKNGKDMLQELSALCADLKLVGIYE